MIEIAYALPEEREEIAQFMHAHIERARWGLEGWRALIDGRWAPPDAPYAITARDRGRLVGVLGFVTTDRTTPRGTFRTMNMTSWIILRDYRGKGIGHRILDLMGSDPSVTITNFTSAVRAVPVVKSAGMHLLDSHRYVWRPRPGAPRLPFGPWNDPGETLLADHSGLPLYSVQVETADGLLRLVLAEQKKHADYVTHEVYYRSDPALLTRHASAIANSLLPQQGAILAADCRLVGPDAVPDDRVELTTPRFWLPGNMRREEIDFLYSEVALLNMKLG